MTALTEKCPTCGTVHAVAAATVTIHHGPPLDVAGQYNMTHAQTALLLEQMTLERDRAIEQATALRVRLTQCEERKPPEEAHP